MPSFAPNPLPAQPPPLRPLEREAFHTLHGLAIQILSLDCYDPRALSEVPRIAQEIESTANAAIEERAAAEFTCYRNPDTERASA